MHIIAYNTIIKIITSEMHKLLLDLDMSITDGCIRLTHFVLVMLYGYKTLDQTWLR